MTPALKVRPTKTELVRLKRRLILSRRIRKILADRLAILMMEFIKSARRAIEVRRQLDEALDRASVATELAAAYHGEIALERQLAAGEDDVSLAVSTRNIAGLRVPEFTLSARETTLPRYDPAGTSSLVDAAAHAGRDALRALIDLAAIQRSLELIGAEIRRTKRISNALEHLVIPGLETTVHSLAMKFEERDREEKARLKHIKVILARTAGF